MRHAIAENIPLLFFFPLELLVCSQNLLMHTDVTGKGGDTF